MDRWLVGTLRQLEKQARFCFPREVIANHGPILHVFLPQHWPCRSHQGRTLSWEESGLRGSTAGQDQDGRDTAAQILPRPLYVTQT